MPKKANTSGRVWANTVYRAEKDEVHLVKRGFEAAVQQKKPKGKPMPKRTAKANAAKSKVRAGVKHVVGWRKVAMELVVRTVGISRAKVKIGLANLYANMRRTRWITDHAVATA